MGRALVAAAAARGLPLGEVTGFRAYPGQGAVGEVTCGGVTRSLCAGTVRFLEIRCRLLVSLLTGYAEPGRGGRVRGLGGARSGARGTR